MTGYMNPDPLQCWDVIYHIFVDYINCYITKVWLCKTFQCLYNRVRPVVGINSTNFFGYMGINGYVTKYVETFRGYIIKIVYNKRKV